MSNSEAIARHRREARKLETDPHTRERHERWLAENRQQHLEEPHKDKPLSRALVDSIHAWAAEHPELIPEGD